MVVNLKNKNLSIPNRVCLRFEYYKLLSLKVNWVPSLTMRGW